MDSKKHIVLLGAGAVGVLPAAKLLRLPEVRLTAAADAGRVARCRREGIYLNGEKLPLDFAAPEEMGTMPPADLVIAATKNPDLPAALGNVAPLTAEKTVFLPLLNGITAKEVISKRFPRNTVLEGFFLGHASVREGNHIRHDGAGTICIGGEKAAVRETEALFRRAGIEVDVPADMTSALWKKFVLNVGVNQTQAVYRADYGEMQKSPEMLDFARRLMSEAAAAAAAEGVAGTETMAEEAMKFILSVPPDAKTSMLQDVLAGRPTEVEAFAGAVCALASKHGLPAPCNRKVLEQLR
ncbi:MAG: ketopantoate reductase family protein [Lentisphaeria bacterium]|nr:ketopantoate reductase family protein [Lentisphaeria bacterium]